MKQYLLMIADTPLMRIVPFHCLSHHIAFASNSISSGTAPISVLGNGGCPLPAQCHSLRAPANHLAFCLPLGTVRQLLALPSLRLRGEGFGGVSILGLTALNHFALRAILENCVLDERGKVAYPAGGLKFSSRIRSRVGGDTRTGTRKTRVMVGADGGRRMTGRVGRAVRSPGPGIRAPIFALETAIIA